MADKSKIEWTDATWNVVTGCAKVSGGCDHCYAETIANRFAGTKAYPNGFDVQLRPERMGLPLRWQRPRRVFVNSLSDLFHCAVPDRFIGEVFNVMGAARRHTFQILTKRHGRMRSLLRRWSEHPEKGCHCPPEQGGCSMPVDVEHGTWPLPNVWLGVSVEDQRWADIRIPALLETPAAVRWISAEPLLGPVDLGMGDPHAGHESDDVNGHPHPRICLDCSDLDAGVEVEWWRRDPGGPRLDWVVVGGESGPGARPTDEDWVRALVAQCASAGIAPFVKQLGAAWAKDWHVGGKSVFSLGDRKGGEWKHWPADLRVREFPVAS